MRCLNVYKRALKWWQWYTDTDSNNNLQPNEYQLIWKRIFFFLWLMFARLFWCWLFSRTFCWFRYLVATNINERNRNAIQIKYVKYVFNPLAIFLFALIFHFVRFFASKWTKWIQKKKKSKNIQTCPLLGIGFRKKQSLKRKIKRTIN